MSRTLKIWMLAMVVALGLAFTAGTVQAQTPDPCIAVDNGSGTVSLPPQGCSYMTADDVHEAIDSLDPNTTIILAPIHTDFICRKLGQCATPGGTLGGDQENFTSTGLFTVVGTGQLAGFSRTIAVPLTVETHTARRPAGATVQSFQTDMFRIQGGISGDPDFAHLTIVGGTANGFPSPGHTTLTRQSNGSFLVDSNFSVNFKISFAGAPGGRLAGFGGTSQGTVKMAAVKKCK
jgi:hypothetical protein